MNRNIEILSLNQKTGTKANIVNALVTSQTKVLKTDYGIFAPNLFQDSANHRSGLPPDASLLLMFLNNITVQIGLFLIVLIFVKIANS